MPKREKTPEPADDEPRFLTIHFPYPAHANLEDQEDAKLLARWIGHIIPPQYLIALHHKPSARNMVIAEIDRTRPREEWRRLLGAHEWNEILVNPTADEKDKVSRVYFCMYGTGRIVQKSGWKRIDVEDTWFIPESLIAKSKFPKYSEERWETLKKSANLINIPYPLSHFCELPTEDPTNLGLARNLPVEYFPREKKPQAEPKFVVGSNKWVDTKLKPGSAWAKGKPNSTNKPAAPSPAPASETRGRTPVKFVPSGTVPFSPPGLPAPPARSMPPDLMRATSSSNSSEPDPLEAKTAGLYLDDDGVVIEGEDSLEDMKGVQFHQPSISSTAIVDSLWDEPIPEQDEKALICTVHGLVCSKGICSVYSAQLKEAERQKRGQPANGKGKGRGGMPFNRGAAPGGGGRARPAARKNDGDNGKWRSNGKKSNETGGFKNVGRPKGKKGSDAGSSEAETEEQVKNSTAWETASVGPW